MIFSGFRSKPLLAFQIHQKDVVTGDALVPSTVSKSVLHRKPFVCLHAFCASAYLSFEIISLSCKVRFIKQRPLRQGL